MGLGFLLCCLRRTRKTTSSQDLAVSSATRHHHAASQISSVGVMPALTTSNSGPKSHEAAQGGDSGPNSHEAAQGGDSVPKSHEATHQPINCPSSMRRFSFSELSQATDNFNEDRVRGSGGFGKVFEAQLSDGTRIALKRRKPESNQGHKEFVTEINLCSGLSRHPNVTSLLGFCDEGNEMILVYEYMGQGTLADRLYGSRSEPCLKWEQRLEILIGAGNGLHYLHSCTERGIIHRDVKGPNILLDDHLVAKMADYGLSKVGPEPDRTHVTTDAKGTRGYMDLEYYISRKLTPKSDVYAFGAVCLEALCARKALDERRQSMEVGLVPWAEQKLKEEGNLRGIADQRIASTIGANSLLKFTSIVKRCVAEKRKDRPSMEQVIAQLKKALQLQRSQEEEDESSGPCSPPCPLSDDSSDDCSDEGRANRPGSLL